MVGGAEEIMPAGELRGVLGRIDQGQRQQGHYEEIKKPRRSVALRLGSCRLKWVERSSNIAFVYVLGCIRKLTSLHTEFYKKKPRRSGVVFRATFVPG